MDDKLFDVFSEETEVPECVRRRVDETLEMIENSAAPQKAAGRREAKSVKPKKLYEMDMSQYTMAGLSNQKWP